ncbi:type II toxin-antitoxin system VapC family toxin [Dyadobacter sandarakinus]|uniref:Type II toxin-antitoxin system VapC family toxin n=1 Tax=Dyadobacter sandarakinus TaxID=2747268 RepID=A0ABX7I7D4_9BACT|nr:type II toxin-antitoxin system VapC family toxin [Dyadobacter sandarakinus]QRR01829.1 type II toxin-antitoxin system VapC family toxin [Dyadobacter sandarakinus]
MGVKYLWDTNTAIYYLQQQFPPATEALIDDIVDRFEIVISVITEIELYCWKTASQQDINLIHQFVSDCTVVELEKNIKLKTADLRKSCRIKLPDAVIAATACVYGLTLLTANVRDFRSIENLQVLNPFLI